MMEWEDASPAPNTGDPTVWRLPLAVAPILVHRRQGSPPRPRQGFSTPPWVVTCRALGIDGISLGLSPDYDIEEVRHLALRYCARQASRIASEVLTAHFKAEEEMIG